MTADQTEQLVNAIVNAAKTAKAADQGPDSDGGTCNFDSPAIKFPKRTRKTFVQTIADLTDVRLFELDSWGAGWYLLGGITNGQGNRRCRMMEAALAVLKAEVPECIEVQGYYQMD